MAKICPIKNAPQSSSDREAAKVLNVNATGGISVSGVTPATNSLQSGAAGSQVAGSTSISGGSQAPSDGTLKSSLS